MKKCYFTNNKNRIKCDKYCPIRAFYTCMLWEGNCKYKYETFLKLYCFHSKRNVQLTIEF